MEQTEFEAAIAPYVVKQVDADNPQIVKYELVRGFRRNSINVKDQTKRTVKFVDGECFGSAVITPFGRFAGVREASEALGIKVATLYYRIKAMEGYEYEESGRF